MFLRLLLPLPFFFPGFFFAHAIQSQGWLKIKRGQPQTKKHCNYKCKILIARMEKDFATRAHQYTANTFLRCETWLTRNKNETTLMNALRRAKFVLPTCPHTWRQCRGLIFPFARSPDGNAFKICPVHLLNTIAMHGCYRGGSYRMSCLENRVEIVHRQYGGGSTHPGTMGMLSPEAISGALTSSASLASSINHFSSHWCIVTHYRHVHGHP